MSACMCVQIFERPPSLAVVLASPVVTDLRALLRSRRSVRRLHSTASATDLASPGLVAHLRHANMGVSYTTRRWRKAFLTIFTQNCRGLKTDARIVELIDVLQQRQAFLCAVQETWRNGEEDSTRCGGWRFLGIVETGA